MPTKAHRRSVWIMPTVVVAAAALLTTLLLLQTPRPDDEARTAATSAAPTGPDASGTDTTDDEKREALIASAERRDADDPLAAGPIDAPVVLVVFSDYQCPFCARWNEDTLPVMMEHADAGDLRIEWRDVNVFGKASERAARAAYAAGLQGAFWKYNDALYPGGKHRPESGLTKDALVELAGKTGLDRERFAADMDSDATRAEVDRNEKLGRDLGAFSTPAFLLGGTPIVGAQPTSTFTEAYDDALARAGR